MTPLTWNPAVWIAENWMYLIGWSVVGLFLYRGYALFSRFLSYGMAITELQTDMMQIKNNHLPHLQEELVHVNENLTGLREDLKEGLGRMSDDLRLVLTRMP